MHRELCRQKILAINIKIADYAEQLAQLCKPNAKMILLRSILADLEKAKARLERDLEDSKRTGESSFTELFLAYSKARQRFSNL